MAIKKSIAPKSVIINKSYDDYTNGKILFNGINEVPSIEAIENTPFSRSFKDSLLRRRENILKNY